MRAQQYAVLRGVERIPHVPGGVMGRHVQVCEVEIICLHFG